MQRTDAYRNIVRAMTALDQVSKERVNGIAPDQMERIWEALQDAQTELYYARRVIYGYMDESEKKELEDGKK